MKLNAQVQYIRPDGKATLALIQLLEAQARLIEQQAAQIAALDVRVTALEP